MPVAPCQHLYGNLPPLTHFQTEILFQVQMQSADGAQLEFTVGENVYSKPWGLPAEITELFNYAAAHIASAFDLFHDIL